ncbi:hypothetical protein GPECTOR_31g307 [Gonium pectorale]|uniref:Ankyrin repeat domain-containing protein n=1 Tax=Gonium pectorale TaxID=33097 RepID=A0A150GED9_GONPE|nr:hypothetical protein GPECTOR_31g307 [Gonium pectorale]|eukprot:KXZ47945.1 hypothetical protein GPECTOR_31g307 [Gonium pectorale]
MAHVSTSTWKPWRDRRISDEATAYARSSALTSQEHDSSLGLFRDSASRVWIPDLVERIARHLPPNELPCTLRLVDKATAALFSGPHHTTVRLSQPVPHHAFARAWGQPGATQPLTLAQRQQLLCLTAATGVTPNLELLLSCPDCLPTTTSSTPIEAAASAGQLAACLRLRQAGCPWGDALSAAAAAGHAEVCTGLLAAGCPWSWTAVCAAASAGQTAAAAALPAAQARGKGRPPRRDADGGLATASEYVVAAARGCDLTTLQSSYQQWSARMGLQQAVGALSTTAFVRFTRELLPAAAGGPAADWQAKVEWLEAQGCSREAYVSEAAAAAGADGLGRVQWLRGRGYPWGRRVAAAFARTGDVAALRYLLAEGVQLTEEAATEAAAGGHLAALQALHAAGCPVSPLDVACAAAEGGHLTAVAWAVEAFGAAATLSVRVSSSAAKSGNPELLAWLRERGCNWGPETFVGAAEAGDGKALAWLAERGCPMPADGQAFVAAARNGDLQTLACLRRLGCPWGPAGEAFGRCLDARCPLAALRWLAAEGCPVDWRAAAERARARWDRRAGEGAQVLAWLEEQRRQQLCESPVPEAAPTARHRRTQWWLGALVCGA